MPRSRTRSCPPPASSAVTLTAIGRPAPNFIAFLSRWVRTCSTDARFHVPTTGATASDTGVPAPVASSASRSITPRATAARSSGSASDRRCSCRDAGRIHQRVDQVLETKGLPPGAFEPGDEIGRGHGAGRGIAHASHHALDLQPQRGERRAQLVRGDRDELVAQLMTERRSSSRDPFLPPAVRPYPRHLELRRTRASSSRAENGLTR